MNEMKILGLDITFDLEYKDDKEKNSMHKFAELLSQFNLSGVEKLISEDYKEENFKANKYHLLIGIKVVLDKFISEGDRKLLVRRGSCALNCYKGKDNLYQLIGTTSGHTFDFGIIEKDGEIVNFHACAEFVDEKGKVSENYHTMFITHVLKLARIEIELNKKV